MTNSVQKSLEMMGSNQPVSTVPSNSKAVIKQAIQDMVKSLELMEIEKNHINEIAKSLKSNHNVKPKVSKKAAQLIHSAKEVDLDFENEVNQLKNMVTQ